MTDTNQASEELREMFKAFVDSGYHACYCPRSVDNGCECAIKDEYIDKVMAAIQSTIRTEKLKLLDKFENDCKYNYTTFGNSEKMLQVSGLLKRIEAERTKLEAEL